VRSKDLTRVMNRLKAIYRSWAIPCAGQEVYLPRHRAAWLEKLRETGVRRRAEQTYQQLDFLMGVRKEKRKELLAESRKHPARKLLEQIPRLGRIRVALLIAPAPICVRPTWRRPTTSGKGKNGGDAKWS
jgi:hypothetical protein